MMFEAMFFDLDDTLYPGTSGVWQAIGVRINQFILERINIAPEKVSHLRDDLFRNYGTTMRGLVTLYGVNAQEYLDYVHDIPINQYLRRDDSLRETLLQYPQRKIIFTNADTNHAKRVIQAIGLEGIFDQIIDIQAIAPYCKPQKEAFEIAFQLANIQHPEECVLIDDALRNLQAARQFGLFSIQVGVNDCQDGCDAAIPSILDLPSVIPVMIAPGE